MRASPWIGLREVFSGEKGPNELIGGGAEMELERTTDGTVCWECAC